MTFSRWLRSLAVDIRPLRFAAFRRVFVGQAVAIVGTMLTQVAVPVQVFDMTRSSLAVGIVSFAAFVPIVILGLYGGALADTVDRRSLYRVSSVTTWLCTLGLLVQALLDLRLFWLVLSLVAVQAGGFALSSTVRGAIIPALVPRDALAGANSLFYTAGMLGQVVGPLIAGLLLLLPNGTTIAYAVDAVLFTAVLSAAWKLPPVAGGVASKMPGVRAVIVGLQFIVGKPVLLVSFLIDIVAMVFAMPEALFPQAAAERGHGGVGFLYASIATGSVLIGLSSGWIGRVRQQSLLLSTSAVVWAAAIAVAGLATSLWTMGLLLVIAGAADLVSAVCRQTILQTVVQQDMRGRLQGVYTVVVASGPRLGDLRAGAMASATTLGIAWSGSAVLGIALIVLVTAAVPSYRKHIATARPEPVD